MLAEGSVSVAPRGTVARPSVGHKAAKVAGASTSGAHPATHNTNAEALSQYDTGVTARQSSSQTHTSAKRRRGSKAPYTPE